MKLFHFLKDRSHLESLPEHFEYADIRVVGAKQVSRYLRFCVERTDIHWENYPDNERSAELIEPLVEVLERVPQLTISKAAFISYLEPGSQPGSPRKVWLLRPSRPQVPGEARRLEC
ncbi:MAG: hypothetical protein LBG44_05390 [Gemmatimonadota bacterium]|nr:hypothetical protein [Gemmatimonadota bacterium]